MTNNLKTHQWNRPKIRTEPDRVGLTRTIKRLRWDKKLNSGSCFGTIVDANNDYLDYFNTIFDNDALFEDFATQIEGFLSKE